MARRRAVAASGAPRCVSLRQRCCGVKLKMKRVAAFAEVDDDTESLFDYDVDRVRFCVRLAHAAPASGLAWAVAAARQPPSLGLRISTRAVSHVTLSDPTACAFGACFVFLRLLVGSAAAA